MTIINFLIVCYQLLIKQLFKEIILVNSGDKYIEKEILKIKV